VRAPEISHQIALLLTELRPRGLTRSLDAGLHAVSRVLSQETVMECCSSTNSLDYEEDLENIFVILAADTVTVRRKIP
jgi:hypothetical protein